MSTLRRLRPLAWKVAPALMAERDRRQRQRVRASYDLAGRATPAAIAHGYRVAGGPLAGLALPAELLAQAEAPHLLIEGAYEHQLHPAVEAAIVNLRRRPGSVFVDAGAADGYYAVGVARTASVPAVAFDLAVGARRATRALAEANSVTVETRGRASERALLKLAPRTGALLVDIDGGELQAVTARLARALRHAVVIVELHGDEAATAIPDRFRQTHHIEIIPGQIEDLRTDPTPWLVATPT